MNDYTNFNAYSHGDLRKMVQSMDSGGVMAASDPWRRAADTLKQIRTTLNTASGDATSSWEGSTSDAFYSKMTKLATAVNNVSAYANDAAITMQMMSEAIDQAKRDMPEEPSFLDKVGNAISDTAQEAVGIDNADTRTTITDQRKAKAVAVMEMLATKYRTAAKVLKPPPSGIDDVQDIPSPDDPSGASAISAVIMGGGMGLIEAASIGGERSVVTTSRPVGGGSQRAPKPPTKVAGPTDPGIRGGMPNPTPRPTPPGGGTGIGIGTGTGPGGGAGTGIDGVLTGGKPGGTGAPGFGNEPGGGGHGGFGNGGGTGGGQFGEGAFGGSRGFGGSQGGVGGRSGAFGSGGLGEEEGGAGAGGRSGMAGGKRTGGAVGEPGGGAAGRRSFTQGGSGLGRSRGQVGQGGPGQGHGGLPGSAQDKKKDKKKESKRPDYLVEDEETWMAGQRANPNVVE